MTVLRLVKPNAEPTLSRAERAFLRQLQRMDRPLDSAMGDLVRAIDHDDVNAGVRAVLRLESIAELLKAAAHEIKFDVDKVLG